MTSNARSLKTATGAETLRMSDIARQAGVSTATVSRALSGHPLVNAATRARILALVQSQHYTVNAGAANLRKREVQTVGVMILGDSLQMISDPFILSLVGHIADELDKRGMNMLLSRVTAERKYLVDTLVCSGQALGVLVIGQMTIHEQLNELAERGVPMVVWGALLPDARYLAVGGDNERGGYLAAQHLLQQGCQRIAFLGDRRYPEVALRLAGYARAHREHGLRPAAKLYQPILYQDAALREAILRWLDEGQRFDAVFATSDVAALTVISALTARGVRVPQDVKVVGYDDVGLSAYVHPSISSVRQPTDLAAKEMVRMLFEQRAGKPQVSFKLPTELVVRDSSRAD